MRRMSRLRVVGLPVLDLTDEAVRTVLGVTEAQLVSNDYATCRRVADVAWKHPERYGGILAPSAAKAGEATLAVSQAWLEGHVEVESSRTQTPPRRLIELFERVAETLPQRAVREAGQDLARRLRTRRSR